MIMFWIIAGIMTLVTAIMLSLPLFSSQRLKPDDAFALEIYRDQLKELVRDEARGLLSAAEAKAAQIEIERRILALDPAPDYRQSEPPSHFLTVAMAVILPLAAFALYLVLGSPQLPSRPLSERQGELNQRTSPEALFLEQKVAADPSNAQAWIDLGRAYARLDRARDAAASLAKAMALGRSEPGLLTDYARFLILAENGMVVPKAREILGKALAKDPLDPMAKFLLALGRAQDGDIAGALTEWIILEARLPFDSDLRPTLSYNIDKAAVQLGRDPMTIPGRRPPRPVQNEEAAPKSDDLDAIATMSAKDRDSFIKSRMLRLRDRLKENPDDLDGWVNLARSWDVLGDRESARAAWARAASLAPAQIEIQLEYAGALLRSRKGETEKLVPDFAIAVNRIRTLDPNNPLGLFYAGLIEQNEGRMENARKLWDRVLSQLPEKSPERAKLEQEIKKLDRPKKP